MSLSVEPGGQGVFRLPLAFVLGGAQSGKTRYAVEVARFLECLRVPMEAPRPVCFVGTARPEGEQGAELRVRLDALRQARPWHWTTLQPSQESPDVVAAMAAFVSLSQEKQPSCVVFDCVTLWLSHELSRDFSKYSAAQLMPHLEAQGGYVLEVLVALAKAGIPTLVVSSETGAGVVPGTVAGRLFRDALGLLNSKIAAAASIVLHMTAGVPLCIREGALSPEHDAPVRCVGPNSVAQAMALASHGLGCPLFSGASQNSSHALSTSHSLASLPESSS